MEEVREVAEQRGLPMAVAGCPPGIESITSDQERLIQAAVLAEDQGQVVERGRPLLRPDALDPGQIEVVAERNTWAPTEVSATSASVLYVDNRDLFHHTFTVDALGIDVDLPAATARIVSLDGAAPGVYDIVCDVPGHEDMVGTLEITG